MSNKFKFTAIAVRAAQIGLILLAVSFIVLSLPYQLWLVGFAAAMVVVLGFVWITHQAKLEDMFNYIVLLVLLAVPAGTYTGLVENRLIVSLAIGLSAYALGRNLWGNDWPVEFSRSLAAQMRLPVLPSFTGVAKSLMTRRPEAKAEHNEALKTFAKPARSANMAEVPVPKPVKPALPAPQKPPSPFGWVKDRLVEVGNEDAKKTIFPFLNKAKNGDHDALEKALELIAQSLGQNTASEFREEFFATV